MSDWVEDGVTPHPSGSYVYVDRTLSGVIRYLDAQRRKHRLDGPAVEWSKGTREWYVDGRLHRLDGPAVELADGTSEWWVDGQLHRLDGPAIERSDGGRQWWLHDVQVTDAEHTEIVAQLREIGEAPGL